MLFEFFIVEVKINLFRWFDELEDELWFKKEVYEKIRDYVEKFNKIRNIID